MSSALEFDDIPLSPPLVGTDPEWEEVDAPDLLCDRSGCGPKNEEEEETVSLNSHSREMGDDAWAEEDVKESRRSKLPPYGLLSSSFHITALVSFERNKSLTTRGGGSPNGARQVCEVKEEVRKGWKERQRLKGLWSSRGRLREERGVAWGGGRTKIRSS